MFEDEGDFLFDEPMSAADFEDEDFEPEPDFDFDEPFDPYDDFPEVEIASPLAGVTLNGGPIFEDSFEEVDAFEIDDDDDFDENDFE